MFDHRNRDLAAALSSHSSFRDDVLQTLLDEAREQQRSLGELLLARGSISRLELLTAVSTFLGIPFRDPDADPEFEANLSKAQSCIPLEIAQARGVLPLRREGDCLWIAAIDPFDPDLCTDFAHLLGCSVRLELIDPDWVHQQLSHSYSTAPTTSIRESGDASDAPASVIEYVDFLLQTAILDGASDLHLEPMQQSFRIRYRVHGELRHIPTPSRLEGASITARLKVMGHLNVTENRVPQDGRLTVSLQDRQVDVRISTLPTHCGESIVLRFLDQARIPLSLDQLGLPPDMLHAVRKVIRQPNGILLATGPTGSGKTTTLYSALRELDLDGSKLLTVEDPVEFDIDGMVQVQTQASIGLDFARTLRAFLRHDPDTLFIGEIRDAETAKIAVQASLTGHRVFSSLHTQDAAGAVPRFVDLGVEPYLVAAALSGVIAQRLLRKLHPQCSESYVPDDAELDALGLDRVTLAGRPLQRAIAHTPGQHHVDDMGRIGIFEFLPICDALREEISAGASHRQLRTFARRQGMRTLREHGIALLLEGITTSQELLQHLGIAESEPPK
ncbi:MAG: GspE/PulE family protein [Puniceicoccaceae bacterium]